MGDTAANRRTVILALACRAIVMPDRARGIALMAGHDRAGAGRA